MATETIGRCGLASRSSQSRRTLSTAWSRERLALARLCSSVAETTVPISATCEAVADAGAVPFHRQRRHAKRRAVGIGCIHQAALAQHMGIVEQILGAVDWREADVEPVQRRGQFCDVPALDYFSGARNDSLAR